MRATASAASNLSPFIQDPNAERPPDLASSHSPLSKPTQETATAGSAVAVGEPPAQRRQVSRQQSAGRRSTEPLRHRAARPPRHLEPRVPLQAGSLPGGRQQEAACTARRADAVGDRQLTRTVPGDHLDVIAYPKRPVRHFDDVPGADARSLRSQEVQRADRSSIRDARRDPPARPRAAPGRGRSARPR
jgi:hypothetical protein